MATVKFTIKRGARMAAKDVAVAAGSAEAQSDTMSLNIDFTKWTKGEVIQALEAMEGAIHQGKWPPL